MLFHPPLSSPLTKGSGPINSRPSSDFATESNAGPPDTKADARCVLKSRKAAEWRVASQQWTIPLRHQLI